MECCIIYNTYTFSDMYMWLQSTCVDRASVPPMTPHIENQKNVSLFWSKIHCTFKTTVKGVIKQLANRFECSIILNSSIIVYISMIMNQTLIYKWLHKWHIQSSQTTFELFQLKLRLRCEVGLLVTDQKYCHTSYFDYIFSCILTNFRWFFMTSFFQGT